MKERKRKRVDIRYPGTVLIVFLLAVATLLLPGMVFALSDERRLQSGRVYDFSLNTDDREISLEKRLERLAKELNEGNAITCVQLPETDAKTAGVFCAEAAAAFEKLGEYSGYGGYNTDRQERLSPLQLDEEHLTRDETYQLIAGYSYRIRYMKWEGTGEPAWSVEVITDCETKKLLAIQHEYAWEEGDAAAKEHAIHIYSLHLENVKDAWVYYIWDEAMLRELKYNDFYEYYDDQMLDDILASIPDYDRCYVFPVGHAGSENQLIAYVTQYWEGNLLLIAENEAAVGMPDKSMPPTVNMLKGRLGLHYFFELLQL